MFKGFSIFEIVSKDFFLAHKGSIIVGVILLLLSMNNRYYCARNLAEIDSLKNKLSDLKYEALSRSSDLIGISRPSQVRDLIRRQGVELEEADKPAYNLND